MRATRSLCPRVYVSLASIAADRQRTMPKRVSFMCAYMLELVRCSLTSFQISLMSLRSEAWNLRVGVNPAATAHRLVSSSNLTTARLTGIGSTDGELAQDRSQRW